MDFIEELSQILQETLKSLGEKDFQKFYDLCDKHMPEPDKYRRLNILKTILVGSKNYPDENVKNKRKEVSEVFNRTELEYCHEKRLEEFPRFLEELNKLFRKYHVFVEGGIEFKMYEPSNTNDFDIFKTRNDYMDADSLIKSLNYNELIIVK